MLDICLERANRILFHPKYQELLSIIEENEKTRIYCKHSLEHFLDVARIMTILNLENNSTYDSNVIYATALLHDIGRAISNENHDEESVKFAKEILKECNYTADEISLISSAIGEHRNGASANKLSKYLYYADKKSRLCFNCEASESCNWSNEKRTNMIYL